MEQKIITGSYNSIDELLIKKYGHRDVASMDFPDFRNKTEFVDRKGDDIGVSVLSYAQAENIVASFLKMQLP